MIATVLLLLVFAGGAFALWQQYGGGFIAPSSYAADPAAASAQTAAQVPDDMAQPVRDLQASQQQLADQLAAIQRQLASEQGERRLLSEQVAALSGRLGGLSGSNASVVTGTGPQLLIKRKPKLPNTGAVNPNPPAPTALR